MQIQVYRHCSFTFAANPESDGKEIPCAVNITTYQLTTDVIRKTAVKTGPTTRDTSMDIAQDGFDAIPSNCVNRKLHASAV